MKAFAKLYWLFSASICNFTNAVIIQGTVPKSLWGKKVVLNGANSDNYKTVFDGPGRITSVNFIENGIPIVSEAFIENKKIGFPLGDFINPNYLEILEKYCAINSLDPLDVSSQFCNTAVRKYLGKYYAIEETCTPIELYYDRIGKIKIATESKYFKRMAAHLINPTTRFSYTLFSSDNPLKYNDTSIPWNPDKRPLFIHTGKSTKCGKYIVFPLVSTGSGNVLEWLLKITPFPLDNRSDTFKWLVYDVEQNICKIIELNEYIDIFHISKLKLTDDIIEIHCSHIYNFLNWLSRKGDLDMKFYKHTIDIKNNKILKKEDLKAEMDFVFNVGDEFIGSRCVNSPEVTIYNEKTKTIKKHKLPGGIVREIIPHQNMLIYYSHEETNTFLYIVDKNTQLILTKIEVPNRTPGFHTTLLD